MIPGIDRRFRLQGNLAILGIDYLLVDNSSQTDLDIHFISPPTVAQQARLTADLVSIAAARGDAPPVAVRTVAFPTVAGEAVMRVETAEPGTFTQYILRIAQPGGPMLLDPALSAIEFSFKAGCYTDVDCEAVTGSCPPELLVDAAVDYQARDFWSLRSALLDFASQRYPRWADRLEADAAMMLLEVMAALGDELAYHQDRIGREAHLETASQRRSLRRHARLVDYQVHDGLGASTWIDVTAKAAGNLEAGTPLYALRDDNRVEYSVGRRLADMLEPRATYAIDPARNDDKLIPYAWDAGDDCLHVGATEMWLSGDVTAALKPSLDDPLGRWILLRTDPADPGLPARRHLVRSIAREKIQDPLTNLDTTHVVWEAAQALPFEMDLASLHVHGNLVPAVAGKLMEREFVIGPGAGAVPATGEDPPWAVERLGADSAVTFLFSLEGTDTEGLVHRGSDSAPGDPREAAPEIRLVLSTNEAVDERWEWRRSLLDAPASQAFDRHYTLDDGTWRRIVGYQRLGGEFVHVDYASDAGATIRFGDNVFGRVPERGSRFRASYLIGNGRRANLPAGAITRFDEAPLAALAVIAAIENPLPIDNGVDPETAEEVRQLAPEAFRALTYRAVRPEDYAEAAQRLDWVQRAGCTFRWTGSWQTAFVTPDPRSSVELTDVERGELERQLDRFRQAGRETHALAPNYADIDLRITICVAPDAYPSEVKARVAAALNGSRTAFFSPDNFTFGSPLARARLEAAIQAVAGVRAVEDITFRRRGFFDWQTLPPTAFRPGRNEVVRVENDPLHPGRGSIQLFTEGGA